MTLYDYSGPMQSFDLRVLDDAAEGGSRLVPVACRPGGTVELPADHPVTVALDAAGYLAPAEIAEPVTTSDDPAEDVIAAPLRARNRAAASEAPKE